MLLAELKEKTNLVDFSTLQSQQLEISWKDKINAFDECDLQSHKDSIIYDLRCEQVKKLGFFQLDSDEMVEMLMGEKHTDYEQAKDRQKYEWHYDHHEDKILRGEKCNWGSEPGIFSNISKVTPWYLPPFSKTLQWKCIFGKLNYLKRDIPYGVVLKINECKQAKIFNVFNVLAPAEAWERKTDIDPIVVGTIFELPMTDKKRNTGGQVSHFFVAQW